MDKFVAVTTEVQDREALVGQGM